MMRIALELAQHDHVYENRHQFFRGQNSFPHAEAMTNAGDGMGL